MTRRTVVRGAQFLQEAQKLFPPGGSVDGTPSFELFEGGPLAAVELLFERSWETQLEAVAGIRFALTHAIPVFPAMVFYAIELTTGEIELMSVTVDDDYFHTIGDDPGFTHPFD